MEPSALREFEGHRPRLFALAYRMLGSAGEAEDAVQETYLRWDGADRRDIRSAEAWLTTALVNLCRGWLVSARARRESYVGPWLPEPVPTARGELGPLETVEEREQVSLALLTALERLTPIERAVFVLREAFGYAHREIADMLDITETNSQQIFRRAGLRVREDRTRFGATPEHARELVERFLKAARDGDVAALERMLAADVSATADGGGKVTAARRPIHGANQVARYLAGLLRWEVPGMRLVVEEINGAPAAVARVDGAPLVVVGMDVVDGVVTALRLIVNPDKLAYLAGASGAEGAVGTLPDRVQPPL
ncbi:MULTISPECIES: RNA polymerase sigma-70 factor [Nocardia]|uniref:RNA polymerase sigma-70 factor n=1 Tax=Nocardia implantans TaxID=3108168 RepID=A0ABU6ALN6_9NOCA|nr:MULTISPECIES: RNA polymerase sigma-70 factor [unclassified Nocardia]MBF6193297.1 RNA polymerase sigma-70 factor [Nocardia beijingensis]MEA3531565.1 RNA polymerase sigma-70 factor [Nocardia sp. CDC192]MEB3508397.1 RNA polymerase sigma-70 factor [Nocardia sp. CDC186]